MKRRPPVEEVEDELEEDPAPPAEDECRGIECRRCGCRHFEVLYTRPAILKRIMRRRRCRNCGLRVTTYEKIS